MVAKCANPSCDASFQYLRGGKLFLLDLPRMSATTEEDGSSTNHHRTAEYFWLCNECSSQLTVIVDRNGQAAVAKAHTAT